MRRRRVKPTVQNAGMEGMKGTPRRTIIHPSSVEQRTSLSRPTLAPPPPPRVLFSSSSHSSLSPRRGSKRPVPSRAPLLTRPSSSPPRLASSTAIPRGDARAGASTPPRPSSTPPTRPCRPCPTRRARTRPDGTTRPPTLGGTASRPRRPRRSRRRRAFFSQNSLARNITTPLPN